MADNTTAHAAADDEREAREGTRFFPIAASALRGRIEEAGFAPAELVWRASDQAGFLAVAGAG